MTNDQERHPLAGASVAELLLVAWRMHGPAEVSEIIQGAGLGKRSLKGAVRQYRALGIGELAKLVQGHVKAAPAELPSFEERRAAQIRRKKRRLASA